MTADDWIRALGLLPHPEGGFYREVYRSPESAADLPSRYDGAARSLGTSIYYLLRQGDRSRFHRLKSDEIWHFHAGGSATVHLLLEDGRYEQRRIGTDMASGERPQVIIPQGCFFGATVEADYILVGCTVFPGFDFADFELADRAALQQQYPKRAAIIELLT